MAKKCKREGCEWPAARRQVYCSRECAPLGKLGFRSDRAERAPPSYAIEPTPVKPKRDYAANFGAKRILSVKVFKKLEEK